MTQINSTSKDQSQRTRRVQCYPANWRTINVGEFLTLDLGLSDAIAQELIAERFLRERQKEEDRRWLSDTGGRHLAFLTRIMLCYAYGYDDDSTEQPIAFQNIRYAVADWLQPTAQSAVAEILEPYKSRYVDALTLEVVDPFALTARCYSTIDGASNPAFVYVRMRPRKPGDLQSSERAKEADPQCLARLLPAFQLLYLQLFDAGWQALAPPEYHSPPMSTDWVTFGLSKEIIASTGRQVALELRINWYQDAEVKPAAAHYKSITRVSPGFFDRIGVAAAD